MVDNIGSYILGAIAFAVASFGSGGHWGRLWFLLGILSAFLLPVSSALGQTNCAPKDVMMVRLESSWQEHKAWTGLQRGKVLELWVSDEDGASWTIIGIWPDGRACIMAAGTFWTDFDAVKGVPG